MDKVTGRLALAADGRPELQAGGLRFRLSTEDASLQEALNLQVGQQLKLTGRVPADDAGVLVVTGIDA